MDNIATTATPLPPKLNTSQPEQQRPPRSPNVDEHGRRRSVFKEIGLNDLDDASDITKQVRPGRVRFGSKVQVVESSDDDDEDPGELEEETSVIIKSPPPQMSRTLTYVRLSFFACLLACLIPAIQSSTFFQTKTMPIGAHAGPIPRESEAELVRRQTSSDPTDICKRWSQQSALVNGTLYLYGGRASTDASQTSNEWNNNLLTIDLTTGWEISSPSMSALPQPSGPPAVANGFLWNSYEQLFLYGGEYSDTPTAVPSPNALWTYDIASSSWTSQPTPSTTAGDNSDGGGQPVQDSAEGAGVNVPELGRGFYFGGHLDAFTTEGWSTWIARVYLKSMIEYTFPGFTNPSISGTQQAGSAGIWRNITSGGLQDSAGFPERADGLLIYVPGFSTDGILLGLAGGTNATFTQMNVIDVFDIASSTWYKQSTSGTTPPYRVNPCSVALSAPDGSSVNIYMYGGQNLVPYEEQVQYSDIWILSIPTFTWISVDTTNQSNPPARAGHSCNVWNSQMVVVGGYVGQNLSCDSPGIYVFETSNLTWSNSYEALGDTTSNPLNQQVAQKADPSGLSGSYGYTVPDLVQKVIGGNSLGGATATTPIATATGGPFATGKPLTYSVTASAAYTTKTSESTSTNAAGAVVTSTSVATAPAAESSSGGPNIAAIVAGVVAGVLFIVASYLGFCAWIYRRHLTLYKNHVAMAQRANMGLDTQAKTGLLFPQDSSDNRQRTSEEELSTGPSAPRGPTQYRPIPGSSKEGSYGYNSGSGNRSGGRQQGDTSDSRSISSTEDLLGGGEPSFLGVILNPRRTLRVTNT